MSLNRLFPVLILFVLCKRLCNIIYDKIHIKLKIQVRINYADSNVYQNPETSACADPPARVQVPIVYQLNICNRDEGKEISQSSIATVPSEIYSFIQAVCTVALTVQLVM